MSDLAAQYPFNPAFSSVNFRVNTPTQVSETFSGKYRRVGMGVSYYTWEAQYTNLLPIDAGTVKGYLAQALGPQFSFRIVIPNISFSKAPNQTTQAVLTSGTMARGSTRVNITGQVSRNILAAGDYFKFPNHSKVYMCVSPCVTNAQGTATLFFSGPALQSVPSGSALTINTVPFTAVLAEDVQEWDVGIGGIVNMSVPMREVF
jgi:hypothetical protein